MPFCLKRGKSRHQFRCSREVTLDGVITSRDVIKNLPLIWREFGTLCALKCIRAVVRRERTTFLDVACGAQAPTVASRTLQN